MPHDWIIDVLTDMRAYAKLNGMEALAEQIDRTLEIARAEIAARMRETGEG
ncbi:MAG: hypothetical protein ACK4TB_13480 [Gemmobacter sp.]